MNYNPMMLVQPQDVSSVSPNPVHMIADEDKAKAKELPISNMIPDLEMQLTGSQVRLTNTYLHVLSPDERKEDIVDQAMHEQKILEECLPITERMVM